VSDKSKVQNAWVHTRRGYRADESSSPPSHRTQTLGKLLMAGQAYCNTLPLNDHSSISGGQGAIVALETDNRRVYIKKLQIHKSVLVTGQGLNVRPFELSSSCANSCGQLHMIHNYELSDALKGVWFSFPGNSE